ncbi:hypothetical protein CAPTEDRAFT_200572 [Capitella teleta]|uniref:Uncharacterized protein n=1 Tax=Capitella teleta TaxID=283909 RepID=R7TFQ6_CAPTE|nr:hypothetical protein CAPTEDRAFT_200572 [Capitella teleta]|eukprot:ELT89881.1 hypothetical protein CAPTEDRAFT_200572 [Capitella teleta]
MVCSPSGLGLESLICTSLNKEICSGTILDCLHFSQKTENGVGSFRPENAKWKRIFGFNVGAQLNCKEYPHFWLSFDINTRTVAMGKGTNPNVEIYRATIVTKFQLLS